jgi:hypothetical protein
MISNIIEFKKVNIRVSMKLVIKVTSYVKGQKIS